MRESTSLVANVSQNKQVWLVRGAVAVASVAGLAVALPVVYGAFLASLGLLGIGVVGVLGAGVIYAAPLIGQKFENSILKLRKAEARQNPIEQMQATLLKRKDEIAIAEKALGRISGIIKSQERKLEDRARTHPNHDLSRARTSVESMKTYYKSKIAQLTQTVQKCKEYEERIDNAMFEKELSQEGQLLIQNTARGAEGDYLQKLLSDEAFKAVSQDFDQLFGDLEVKSLLEAADQYEGLPEYNVTVERAKPEALLNER